MSQTETSQVETKPDTRNKPMISIVDDDQSMREATADLMRALDFSAETFPCAEDFLDSDRRDSTACLIADVRMPGMSGIELHDHLTAIGHPIPMVLITAYPDDRVRARALRSGVVCYLSKPFSDRDLMCCIQSALKQGHADGALADAQARGGGS